MPIKAPAEIVLVTEQDSGWSHETFVSEVLRCAAVNRPSIDELATPSNQSTTLAIIKGMGQAITKKVASVQAHYCKLSSDINFDADVDRGINLCGFSLDRIKHPQVFTDKRVELKPRNRDKITATFGLEGSALSQPSAKKSPIERLFSKVLFWSIRV